MVGVAGRNGAGKSHPHPGRGRLHPAGRQGEAGRVRLDRGTSGSRTPVRDLLGEVGIVFSTPSNQLSGSKLTVREELAFGLENLGVARSAMDERIDATLAALGIGDLAERLPTGLSGGEQQRVAIAAILCMGPRLIVLDEPTAQLDPAATRAVAELLAGRAVAGTAVLVAEHEAAVLGLAGRCLVLDGGRAAGLERPGVALGPTLGGRAGVSVPAVVAVAAALEVPATRRWTWRPSRRPSGQPDQGNVPRPARRSLRHGTASSAIAGGAVAAWEPVREQPPAGIEVVALRHAYADGREALRGVDLDIAPGEAVAIVGQNGSGKTTLAKHLVRILVPQAGTVHVAGRDLAGRTIADVARTVGFVFQDPDRQLFSRSVEREASFGRATCGFAMPTSSDSSPSRSPPWDCRIELPRTRTTWACRTGSSWRWRASWRWIRRSSCSTSRRRARTHRASRGSARSWRRSPQPAGPW